MIANMSVSFVKCSNYIEVKRTYNIGQGNLFKLNHILKYVHLLNFFFGMFVYVSWSFSRDLFKASLHIKLICKNKQADELVVGFEYKILTITTATTTTTTTTMAESPFPASKANSINFLGVDLRFYFLHIPNSSSSLFLSLVRIDIPKLIERERERNSNNHDNISVRLEKRLQK